MLPLLTKVVALAIFIASPPGLPAEPDPLFAEPPPPAAPPAPIIVPLHFLFSF
jgi:hypothetical protein